MSKVVQDEPELVRQNEALRLEVEALEAEAERLRTILDRTAQQEAQGALRASLARYEALLASIPDIVMEVDADRVYSWANQPGLDFFGDDVVGKEAAFYFEGEQDTYDKVQPLFEGVEQVFYVESWQRRRDGAKRLLAWWCRVLKDESGNVTGALSTARDVTEERRVAAENREAQERFRIFFDNAPIGKSMTAPDGKLMRVNGAFAAMLGYSVEELHSTSFTAITHPDDLPESQECIRSLLAGERESWSMDKRYIARDGHLVWTHVVTRMQRDSRDRPVYLLTHILDISARRRAEDMVSMRLRLLDLSTTHTLGELLQKALDEVESMTGSSVGFYHFVKEDQRALSLQAWSTRTVERFCTAKSAGPHHDIEEAGVWVDCVRQRRPVVHNDYEALPHKKGLPEGHVPVVRELVVPIMRNGKVVAILGVGNKATDYTQQDVSTASYLADVAWEIASRKRVEEALQESEARFRAIYENMAAASCLDELVYEGGKVVDYRILEVNPSYERLIGIPRSRAVGALASELYGTGTAPFLDTFTKVVETGEPASFEAHFAPIHKDLSFTVGSPSPGRFSAVYHDITEKKRAEEALRAQEEKYRLLAENTVDVIWTMGLDLELKYVNPAITRLTGHTPKEWIGSKLSERFEQSSFEGMEKMLSDEMAKGADGEDVVFETSLRRTDGQLVPVEVHAKVVLDGKGTPILVQGVTRDITERRELAAQLAQSDRLRAMGTLAAGIAHEINNPLSFVLYNIDSLSQDVPRMVEALRRCHEALGSRFGADAAAEMLGGKETFDPVMLDDVVDRFRDALTGTVRIKDIVRGLGTFSHVDRTEVAPIGLHHAVEQAISLASNEIRYRARLVKDLGQVPMVLGSDGKLAQVFLNLLINSAQAIDEGHVERNEIRVRTWTEKGQVFAEVSDTGRGIDPEHLGKVFEPFFTTKEVGVGTGLGLPICKNIIEGFGGEIGVASEVGKGTRFLVRLPCVPDDWESQDRKEPKKAPARAGLRGRILVVDDEPAIRSIIVRMLSPDHELIAVSSGEEAQALLEKDRRFDLVFCDLMMPQMSGMELHAWIAQREPSLAGQVVFITGGAFTPGASEYLGKVENLRIEKPFDAATLERTAQEMVLASRAKRGA